MTKFRPELTLDGVQVGWARDEGDDLKLGIVCPQARLALVSQLFDLSEVQADSETADLWLADYTPATDERVRELINGLGALRLSHPHIVQLVLLAPELTPQAV